MTKKISRMIAIAMLVIAIAFIIFAFGHPEMTFPWSNTISYLMYGAYLIVMAIMFIAPFIKK